ncbi:MAG: hypothetical protein ACXACD_14500 [Candidatus Thorarchaeota archaeon]|jgi:hypothetical protein
MERESNVVTNKTVVGLVGIGLSSVIIGVILTVVGWNTFEEWLSYSTLHSDDGILIFSPVLVAIGVLLMIGGIYSIATSKGKIMRKLMVGGTIIVLVFATVSGVMTFEPYSTHYEETVRENNTYVYFRITEPEGGNISITFVDDPTLLYRVDFEQHPSGPKPYMSYYGSKNHNLVNVGVKCDGQVNSIDVVLGTGLPYSIFVQGRNLTTIITYSNGSLTGGSEYNHYASGTLLFAFMEDVNVTEGNMEVNYESLSGNMVNDPLHIAFVIDLPDGMDGQIDLHSVNYFDVVDMSGWWHRGNDRYSTAINIESPALVIDGWHTSSVLAWLHD